MQYRKFGKDGWNVSALGFGAMRLPNLRDNTVDTKAAVDVLRYGIDQGINYIDTAYIYHNGESESIVGRALKDGYGKKVRVADKSPSFMVNTSKDFVRILDEQLVRLGLEHIDYYMFHGIGQRYFDDVILKEGLLLEMEKAREAGKIGHIGFSFHDNTTAFKHIIDGYDGFEFCMVQYNYMDVNRQAGQEGFDYAAQKGVPIIVMEPLLGGRLANPPKDVTAMMDAFPTQRSPAAWSLSWIWNHPAVATVLSGMASNAQVEENCRIANDATPGHLTAEEEQFISSVHSVFSKRAVIPCTRCNYCKPCPEGIDIGWLLELYNDAEMFDNLTAPRFAYNNFVPQNHRADACTACGACEDICPQKIAVSKWMPKVHSVLGPQTQT
ncbi:MAG: aldo/keto reductase [Deltaproteobacteria bacterium]|nr:aldo/keto reductase [Deltaproteobacteria bacterium]